MSRVNMLGDTAEKFDSAISNDKKLNNEVDKQRNL